MPRVWHYTDGVSLTLPHPNAHAPPRRTFTHGKCLPTCLNPVAESASQWGTAIIHATLEEMQDG